MANLSEIDKTIILLENLKKFLDDDDDLKLVDRESLQKSLTALDDADEGLSKNSPDYGKAHLTSVLTDYARVEYALIFEQYNVGKNFDEAIKLIKSFSLLEE